MQNLPHFQYCPNCGQPVLEPRENKGIRCPACGFIYYFNPVSAVSALIEHEGKLIFIQRGREPEKGLWAFPGGFVDNHESLEEALTREVREETRLEVQSAQYLCSIPDQYPYGGVIYQVVISYFIVQPRDMSQVKAGDDAANFRMVAPEEANPAELAFTCNAAALQQYKISR
jgi:NAD+ diphosphatase